MGMIKLLKKLPIDLAQAEMKEKTKGKLIAYSYVPQSNYNHALDIGCRDGYWTKKLIQKGYTVEPIDIEPHYPGAKKADANEKLPYRNETFDIIWCSEVIEHLKNPKESVKEMLRITRPGGRIIITTPNSHFWIQKMFNLIGWDAKKIQNPGHKHFFSKKTLKKVLPKNAKIYGYFPYFLIKMKIQTMTEILSPTFVAIIKK